MTSSFKSNKTTYELVVHKTNKKPTLLLVGSFDDFFLEALNDLDFNFTLHKSSQPKRSEKQKYDVIVFDEDRSNEALDYIKVYKAIPVLFAKQDKELVQNFYDYDPITEEGNSFLYFKNSTWSMFESLIRASETFKFTYDWKNLKNEIADTAKYAESIKKTSVKN